MVNFRLKGFDSHYVALKVKKLIDTPEGMKEKVTKVHLRGSEKRYDKKAEPVTYDSEKLTQSFNIKPISWEEIKEQLGDNIVWNDETEVKNMSNDNDKPEDTPAEKKKDKEEDD